MTAPSLKSITSKWALNSFVQKNYYRYVLHLDYLIGLATGHVVLNFSMGVFLIKI